MSEHSHEFTRRRLLDGLGLVTVTGAAGCTSFGGSQTATGRSARIQIIPENADDTEQAYEVEVIWGGNDRSQFSGMLAPTETGIEMLATTGAAPEEATFFIGAADDGQSGTWRPTDCPDYRVDAVLENGTPSFDTTCQD